MQQLRLFFRTALHKLSLSEFHWRVWRAVFHSLSTPSEEKESSQSTPQYASSLPQYPALALRSRPLRPMLSGICVLNSTFPSFSCRSFRTKRSLWLILLLAADMFFATLRTLLSTCLHTTLRPRLLGRLISCCAALTIYLPQEPSAVVSVHFRVQYASVCSVRWTNGWLLLAGFVRRSIVSGLVKRVTVRTRS
jgi:hypothetical protein